VASPIKKIRGQSHGCINYSDSVRLCICFASCLLIVRLACRSPWSNKYDPPLEDGTVPSEEMRNLEIEANEVFSVYRDQ